MNSKTHKRIAIGLIAGAVVVGLFFIVVVLASVGDVNAARSLSLRRTVAVVRIEGVIIDGGWHTSVLREHLNNRNIAGVLLRIDSPGGAVAPSQEIYGEVAAYKDAGKPLVVSMGNVAASGGYYIASPAYRIFALPGTITGSIGVIFTLPIYQELAKKVGVDFRVLKAGDFKDMGSPYRPMEEREKKALQSLLDDTHEQFVADVAFGRDADVDSIRAVSDGRIFTGRQAFELNLVDTLGSYADALSYLKEICGVPENARPVERRQYTGWRELLMETTQKHFSWAALRPAGLYYLFAP